MYQDTGVRCSDMTQEQEQDSLQVRTRPDFIHLGAKVRNDADKGPEAAAHRFW